VDRLMQSVNDCPKVLKNRFSDEDPEKEFVIEA
jgi:hypothetical protein